MFDDAEPTAAEIEVLDGYYRQQVKLAEDSGPISAELASHYSILKALKTDEPEFKPSKRGASSRDTARPTIDSLDGPADSPAPSPVVANSRKERLAAPRGTSSKDPSVQLEDADPIDAKLLKSATGKIKVVYERGDEVAWKPKAKVLPTGEVVQEDWILATVVTVIGDGKSRRYEVQDQEPDEKTHEVPEPVRTSASSMAMIPPAGAALPDYEVGKEVGARYPDTTAFYLAKVEGMREGRVALKFDGEEDDKLVKEVERRWVLDDKNMIENLKQFSRSAI